MDRPEGHCSPHADSGSDDAAFIDSLGLLHTLVLGLGDVQTFLTNVAELAADSLGAGASCGITARDDPSPMTVATSDGRAALADEDQYGAGEGPCLQAMATGQIVDVPDQAADRRWTVYRQAALDHGVRCSLSLPLIVNDASTGALNIYQYDAPHSFGDQERYRADVFASQAATALTLVLRVGEQDRLAGQVAEALRSRSTIDQALGILMAQQKCDAPTAFALLRHHSQCTNQKLHDVAARVVEGATGHSPSVPSDFET